MSEEGEEGEEGLPHRPGRCHQRERLLTSAAADQRMRSCTRSQSSPVGGGNILLYYQGN